MERVELTRECEGVQVPAGNKMMLEKGLEAFITQSLGGTFTVQVPAYGGLFRIAGKDADALGKTPEQAGGVVSTGGDLEAMVWEQLKTCFDPEIPVNIVDLGLVYRVTVTPDPDAPGIIPKHRVEVDMSMTSPGCPAHGMIMDNVRNRLACIQEIGETQVNLVWEPTWGPERISEAARKQLGIG